MTIDIEKGQNRVARYKVAIKAKKKQTGRHTGYIFVTDHTITPMLKYMVYFNKDTYQLQNMPGERVDEIPTSNLYARHGAYDYKKINGVMFQVKKK